MEMEQEQSQPTFRPPMARIPQIPPQQVAGNRRVYVAPKIVQPSTLRSTAPRQRKPAPGYYTPQFVSPARQHWAAQPEPLPETPRPRLLVLNPLSPAAGEPSAQTRFVVSRPRTPPYRIPSEWRREAEPGISETLLGCAILLLIAIFALAIAYFLFV